MLLLVSAALAYDPAALQARLDAIEPLRSERLAEHAPAIPADAYTRAAGGKVVTGIEKVGDHAAKLGWGVGVFDVSIDALWRALNDELHHEGLTPLSRVELVAGSPCADGRKVLMVLPLPLISDRYWVNQNRYATALASKTGGQLRELVWDSVADPSAEPLSTEARAAVDGLVEIGFNKGSWFLVALDDGHTLAEYHSWVDPGGSVPAGAASAFATSGIVDTFDAMGRYARGGQSHCR
jgi:hypothetical protein